LLGKSPKTPVIYIGVSLFDALFEKVRHFLTHLLEKCSTFGTPFLKIIFRALDGVSLFDTLFGKVLHFLTHLLKNGATF